MERFGRRFNIEKHNREALKSRIERSDFFITLLSIYLIQKPRWHGS